MFQLSYFVYGSQIYMEVRKKHRSLELNFFHYFVKIFAMSTPTEEFAKSFINQASPPAAQGRSMGLGIWGTLTPFSWHILFRINLDMQWFPLIKTDIGYTNKSWFISEGILGMPVHWIKSETIFVSGVTETNFLRCKRIFTMINLTDSSFYQ